MLFLTLHRDFSIFLAITILKKLIFVKFIQFWIERDKFEVFALSGCFLMKENVTMVLIIALYALKKVHRDFMDTLYLHMVTFHLWTGSKQFIMINKIINPSLIVI